MKHFSEYCTVPDTQIGTIKKIKIFSDILRGRLPTNYFPTKYLVLAALVDRRSNEGRPLSP